MITRERGARRREGHRRRSRRVARCGGVRHRWLDGRQTPKIAGHHGARCRSESPAGDRRRRSCPPSAPRPGRSWSPSTPTTPTRRRYTRRSSGRSVPEPTSPAPTVSGTGHRRRCRSSTGWRTSRFNLLASARTRQHLHDVHSGQRAYRRSLIDEFEWDTAGPAFPVDLLLWPAAAGRTIKEFPIPYRDRIGETTLSRGASGAYTMRRLLRRLPRKTARGGIARNTSGRPGFVLSHYADVPPSAHSATRRDLEAAGRSECCR